MLGAVAAAVAVVAAIALISRPDPAIFAPYFAGLSPPAAAAIVCVTGLVALVLLHRDWDFVIFDGGASRRRALVAVAWSVPFMIAVTAADLVAGFPREINVPLPAALAFYPAMGLIAQLALHVIPMTLLLYCGRFLFRRTHRNHLVLISIGLAAMPEAGFQLAAALQDDAPTGLGVFVAIHLFAFGLVELGLFRRYDYAAMYVFRLSYYSWWHIVWGWLRLSG